MAKQKVHGFARFATWFGDIFGSPLSFVLSFLVVIIWASILGPVMHFTDTWQLLINTPTTIIELFAAITIQFVGNRIQRQQEANEEKMLQMLAHLEELVGKKKPPIPPADF